MSIPNIIFRNRRERWGHLRAETYSVFVSIMLCGLFAVGVLSSCKRRSCEDKNEAAETPKTASYDANMMRTMSFENWLAELTALPGDRTANIDRYAGTRIRWSLNYLAGEINTAYDPQKELSPANWKERYRMFSARLKPEADFGDIIGSPYPFQVVAVPEMGKVETRLERGAPLNVEATIWGADGGETIFLRDFVITAAPSVSPEGSPPSTTGPGEAGRDETERSQTKYRVVYETATPKHGDTKRGDLSKELIRRIIHRHINEIKFCYERDLAADANFGGFSGFKLIIDGGGSVSMVAVAIDPGHEQVEKCMAEAIRKWQFPAPDGGGPVIITYPMQVDGGF